MQTSISVGVRIISDYLTPDQIESIIGVKSDRSWTKGQIRPKTNYKEKNSGWVIQSYLQEVSNDVNVVYEELIKNVNLVLDRIMPQVKKVKELSKKNQVLFYCGMISEDGRPILYFKKDIIKKLATLGAEFDIDLYILHLDGKGEE